MILNRLLATRARLQVLNLKDKILSDTSFWKGMLPSMKPFTQHDTHKPHAVKAHSLNRFGIWSSRCPKTGIAALGLVRPRLA